MSEAKTEAKTLLQMLGVPAVPSTLEKATLVLIDMQNEYLPTGGAPLLNVERALDESKKLLERARKAGTPVVHVVHHGGPGFFDPAAINSKPNERVAPIDGEPVIPKTAISAFVNNPATLEALEKAGRKELIVIGFMTHMCVSTFVRAAVEQYGYKVTVVADCTATRPLPGVDGKSVVPADQLQTAAIAAMQDFFATVVPSIDNILDK